ncbi:MAG TPA: pyridoxamine 5'-phosphate oxidase family protein [Pseudonocardia sp.]|nr:pyridoxamine 5'-phosphate oxidase family protein [Pseudonocardia sp.]
MALRTSALRRPGPAGVRTRVAQPAAGVGPSAVAPEEPAPRPGSSGEHLLQAAFGTQARAERFYAEQVRDRLLPAMVEFIGRMEMVFVASADAHGECDASLRAGPPGFLRVLDEYTLAYPEYRGNGVHASLGNISENGNVGLLMVDFVDDLIGLHVNGAARILTDEVFRVRYPHLRQDAAPGRRAERWVVVEVQEAYVHCRKHIPRMQRMPRRRAWGTDDPGRKGGDYFGAKGTPRRVPRTPRARRAFPSTTHLGGGSARTLRPRPASDGGHRAADGQAR